MSSLESPAAGPLHQQDRPAARSAGAAKAKEAGPDDSNACLDPPTEAEVWAKVCGPTGDGKPSDVARRDKVRILVEKIATKVDPVRVYPLAGPCQLVHCHYKCTVTYDEIHDSDYPIPSRHVDHKVEVVYIDKDHLRRAPRPAQTSQDGANERPDTRDPAPGRSAMLSPGPIAEVIFEGIANIPAEKFRAKLLSKAGEPFNAEKINDDIRFLMRTNWFAQVEAYYDESPPGSGKYALIFSVREMPRLTHVEFRGRKEVRLEEIEDTTGLKKGSRADYMRTRNAVQSIDRLYKQKGYDQVKVELIEGGNPGDARVVMEIFEGPQHTVRKVIVEGNSRIKTDTLMADLELRPGRPYVLAVREADRRRILVKYCEIDCIDAEVRVEPRFTSQLGVVDVVFRVQEGEPYLLGELEIRGNDRVMHRRLRREVTHHERLSGDVAVERRLEIKRHQRTSQGNPTDAPDRSEDRSRPVGESRDDRGDRGGSTAPENR